MKQALIVLLLVSLILFACASKSTTTPAQTVSAVGAVPAATPTTSSTITTNTSAPTTGNYRIPPKKASWQIQYTGEIDINLDMGVFNLDLFETSSSVIEALHQRGVFVMCYFSAGSYEDWRPDYSRFLSEVLGKEMEG